METLVLGAEQMVSDGEKIQGHLEEVRRTGEKLRVLLDEVNITLARVSEQSADTASRLERVRRGTLDMLIKNFEKQHLLRGGV